MKIAFRANSEADRLQITVKNDTLMTAAGSKPLVTGVGLRNVTERLRAGFPDDGLFSSGPVAPGRYRATINLPWRVAERPMEPGSPDH